MRGGYCFELQGLFCALLQSLGYVVALKGRRYVCDKVSLFTPDSDLTIVGNTFKVYRSGQMVEWRTLETEAEAVQLLTERFGIRVPCRFRRFLYPAEQNAADHLSGGPPPHPARC